MWITYVPSGGIEPPLRDPQSRVLSVERRGPLQIYKFSYI